MPGTGHGSGGHHGTSNGGDIGAGNQGQGGGAYENGLNPFPVAGTSPAPSGFGYFDPAHLAQLTLPGGGGPAAAAQYLSGAWDNTGKTAGQLGYLGPTSLDDNEEHGQYGMDQALNLYNQGPPQLWDKSRIAGFGDASQNAFSAIQNQGQANNPFLQGFNNNSSNPIDFQGFDASNPAINQFNGFSNQQNTQLDNIFDRGADQIQDRLNSQFGMAGRSNSGYHQKNIGNALGDFGAGLYGNAFDSMQNRNLQATQGASSAYQGQNAQNLQAMNYGSNAFNQGQQNQLNYLNSGSNAYQNQYNQNSGYNQDLLNLGQTQDQMSQLQLSDQVDRFGQDNNQGWGNLQNYMDIVGQYKNGPPERQKADRTGQAIGLIGAGLAAASSKDYKEDNQEFSALDKLVDMPVEKWKYKEGIDDEDYHVGPYAEDFKESFGLGDGKSIRFVDSIGVLMRSVQELAGEVREMKGAMA